MGECIRRNRLLVGSSQYDEALRFVGGSPFLGDLAATGVVIPDVPTPSQDTRYLVRCCGVSVGINQRAVIRSIRQLLTIGVDVLSGDQGRHLSHFEIPVTTPTWRFQDGNVSWHLRRVVDDTALRFLASDRNIPSVSSTRTGLSAAILGFMFLPIGPYIPLNKGLPYGQPICDLGTFRDVRECWANGSSPSRDLDLEVVGPCDIVLYASVRQTDPETRISYQGDPDQVIDALCPEDKFLLRFPTCRYWRVGGEMVVDMCTYDPEGGCNG